MARKYTKAKIGFTSSLDYTAAIPVDTRFVVAAETDLTADATWKGGSTISAAYVGLTVYVEGTSSLYVLTNANYGTLDNWKKLATVSNQAGGTNYKGVKESLTELNAVDSPSAGDMYYVTHAELRATEGWSSVDGAFYIYNGTSWDKINKEDAAHATNASTADELTTEREINGLKFKGNANVTNFAVCGTDANVQNKSAAFVNLTIAQGTEIRVQFTNENTATSPTLNGYPLMRGAETFDKWEAGAVVTFTCVGTGVNRKWQAHEVEGQSTILRQTTAVDFSTFDFNNADGITIYQHTAPLESSSLSIEVREALFEAMMALGKASDGKLHFIKFKGRRYKFDIDDWDESTEKRSVSFSFIYRSYKKSGKVHSANLVTITWGRIIQNESPVYNWDYKVTSLIGSSIDTSQFVKTTDTDYINLKTDVDNLKETVKSVKWYSLIEDSQQQG